MGVKHKDMFSFACGMFSSRFSRGVRIADGFPMTRVSRPVSRGVRIADGFPMTRRDAIVLRPVFRGVCVLRPVFRGVRIFLACVLPPVSLRRVYCDLGQCKKNIKNFSLKFGYYNII